VCDEAEARCPFRGFRHKQHQPGLPGERQRRTRRHGLCAWPFVLPNRAAHPSPIQPGKAPQLDARVGPAAHPSPSPCTGASLSPAAGNAAPVPADSHPWAPGTPAAPPLPQPAWQHPSAGYPAYTNSSSTWGLSSSHPTCSAPTHPYSQPPGPSLVLSSPVQWHQRSTQGQPTLSLLPRGSKVALRRRQGQRQS